MNNFPYSSFVSIHYIICECGDTFPTEESLNEHLENEHKSIETNEYQCNTCGKIFPTENACVIHQRIHYRCYKTQRESYDKDKFKKYIKNIVCEVCGKRYASNAALRYHQRVHTGERPYQCSMCPKNFTMPLFLQIHIRTHTGERPYECPVCPKAFSNKAALLRHDRVHTGIKPYECPQCGKFFTQSNSMKLHVKTVHLKMPAPYKSKTRRAKQALRDALAPPNSNVIIAKKGTVVAPKKMSTPVLVTNVHKRSIGHMQIKTEIEENESEPVETYHIYQEDDEGLYDQVKVEITEMPMYEDLENSEIVYEEVYETEVS